MLEISNELRERLRCVSKDVYPFKFIAQYVPLPDIPNPPAFLGGGSILLEIPFETERLKPGSQIEVYRDGKYEFWEIVYSEVYSGGDNNIVNGIVICWCQPVEV